MRLAEVKHVQIGDVDYPVKLTQRAMIEYEAMAGEGMMSFEGSAKMSQLFYCAAKAGAKAEGKAFNYTYDQFLDVIDDYPLDILNNFGGSVAELFTPADASAKKKQ